MSIRFKPSARFVLLAISALALGTSPLSCASTSAKQSTASDVWPATIAGLRDAIEVERARLKEIVSKPAEGSARSTTTPEDLIAIADRLSRLQASLEMLEAEERGAPETRAP